MRLIKKYIFILFVFLLIGCDPGYEVSLVNDLSICNIELG